MNQNSHNFQQHQSTVQPSACLLFQNRFHSRSNRMGTSRFQLIFSKYAYMNIFDNGLKRLRILFSLTSFITNFLSRYH